MAMICPECYTPLLTTDGKVARCKAHGGEYQVLFLRNPAEETARSTAPAAPAGAADAPPASASFSPPPLLAEMKCVQHPASPATAQCQSCGAYMCATCDFVFPGDLHLCPTCATKPRTGMGKRRRKGLIWSYICATVATLGFALTMGYAAVRPPTTEAEQNALGSVMSLCIFIPSIVGLGVGLGAMDRRFSNPVSLWVATLWNGLILAVFMLLSVIGTMQ